jgi:phage-related protein
MSEFPKLKTGAVAQYPLQVETACRTRVLRCIDGTEQRFRTGARALRKWEIRLDLLDEAESSRVEQFFRDQHGRDGAFSFVDPTDGQEYPRCSFDHDECRMEFEAENRTSTVLVVKENVD